MARKRKILLRLGLMMFGIYLVYFGSVYFEDAKDMANFIKAEICVNFKEFFPTEFDHNVVPSATKSTLVLIFTNFFSSKYWTQFKDSYDYSSVCGCNFTRFELIYDRKRFLESDVVIFHGRNMPCVRTLRKLHKQRRPHQLWAYFIHENPKYHDSIRPVDAFFNMSISYRLNSDVYLPYKRHFLLNPPISKDLVNYASGKTKQVAWFVSSCGKLREKLAHKLVEHGIKIEVRGECAKRFKYRFDCKSYNCDVELRQFKFYFAAENTLCDDYVTEKYWIRPIQYNLIPIVFGGANYSNPKLVIPGSFIDAMSFKNVKELASYIKEVDSNEELFNSYFEWKKYWGFQSPNGCDPFYQQLCDRMNTPRERKLSSYVNIKECETMTKYFESWIQR